ncbi:Hsp20/alpha crystallin family protein [Halovivax gelatinilyticus]|uniref:Hsp20/alpha crystallin family protein n=1 Tax=Halovivax gelatinilyticus TaxID=2961597 RepID=UPI0020CA8F6C|nr:Hsp20 family protein [Halovivax gelatinilyticus]
MNPRTVVRSLGDRLYRGVGRATRSVQSIRPVDADLLENETSYLVAVDTPGVESSDLDIRYLDGRVTVTCDRNHLNSDRFERRFWGRTTTLSGSISLPDDAIVDANEAEARLTSVGTVRIELPKESPETRAEPAGEQIPIDD